MARPEAGFTLLELVAVVALVSMVAMLVGLSSMPLLGKEGLRSSMAELQAFVQLTRIEAATRNHDCRMLVNESTGWIGILDTMGTGSSGDDELLHQLTLPSTVRFARPDSGSALTVDHLSGPWHQVVFTEAGTALVGAGEIHVFGGGGYSRLSVYGAGGVRLETWQGSSWTS